MRIFLAGATGVIGVRLVPLLVGAGHRVAGLTRSPGKAGELRELGAAPVVGDVFDAAALTEAVKGYAPDLVLHQLTDLPDNAADIAAYAARSGRIRSEGTRNLLAAAAAAGADRFIAQSVSWELPAAGGRRVTAEHEHMVLQAGGVVLRYGQFWGPGTYYESRPPEPPRIHVEAAARQTAGLLAVPGGLTIVIDDRAA
jgi:nucleoside-diphosphate-sugar epimerase